MNVTKKTFDAAKNDLAVADANLRKLAAKGIDAKTIREAARAFYKAEVAAVSAHNRETKLPALLND